MPIALSDLLSAICHSPFAIYETLSPIKLTLAFIFTSLIGIMLVGVIARYVTAYEFDRLLRERTNSQLLLTAKAYYQEKIMGRI